MAGILKHMAEAPKRIPDAQMHAWRTFLFAQARLLDALERELVEATGLSLSWYDVLVQLHEAGESVRMGDLAESLLISASAATRLVDRMEKQGLVERVPCPTDRRVTFVALTDSGLERLRDAAPTHMAGVERHFTQFFTRAKADELAALLEPVLEAHS